MDSFFSNMGTWITHLSPWMIFTLVLIVVLSYIFKNPLSSKISKFKLSDLKFWGKSHEVENLELLKSHDLFNVTQKVRDEIKFIRFITHKEFDVTKTKMCQDFTNFKCDEIDAAFMEFLNKPNLDTISTDELKHLMFDAIMNCSTQYTQKTKQLWMDKGILKDDVDYVIDIFDKYRHDVITAFTSRINSIFSSSFHSSNFERILGCFEIFSMAVDLLPRDMIITFESLNGKFKNIKY